MKKVLALILTALMLMTFAVAEEQTAQLSGWHIALDQLTVTVGNETVTLNPSLNVLLQQNDQGVWAQLGVMNNGEPAAALQVEYYGDAILASAEGANDTLIIDGAEMFLNQYEMTGEEVRGLIGMILSGLAENELDELAASGMLDEEDIFIEVVTEGSEYILSYSEPDASISVRLVTEPYAGEAPFDLAAKNLCRYTFREMFPGEGTDIVDTLLGSLSGLMADESIASAAALLGESLPAIEM